MANKGIIMRFPDLKSIEAEAAGWLVQLDDEEATPEDYAEFQVWRAQSDQHRVIFDRLSLEWKDLDWLQKVSDYATVIPNEASASFRERKARSEHVFKYVAGIILSVGVALFYWALFMGSPQTYETGVGERKSIELADGSVIELNTDTRILIDYTRSKRDIQLLQGEAYFEIAHDPSRPLSVFAGKRIVKVLGTTFTVHRIADRLDVIVSEGHVALAIRDNISPEGDKVLAEITAGQDAIVGDDGIQHIRDINLEELTRKLSWRNGILSFKGEALSEVVADMSRYTDLRIEIADDELKNLPVDGYFRVGEIETMIKALELMTGLRAEYRQGDFIRLSKS